MDLVGFSSQMLEISRELDDSPQESIYFILRNLIFNDNQYNSNNNWGHPDTLKVVKL